MCKHEYCPINEGKCITSKPGWEWAEKFGLPSANPTQRQFLIEQSARWNAVVVKEGENPPNPVEGSPCDDSEVPVLTPGCGCGGKREAPSTLTRATNFVKAIGKHAANGFAQASEEEKDRRLSICNSCPLLRDGSCLECGCVVKIKAGWASEKCPLNKWEKIEDAKLAVLK